MVLSLSFDSATSSYHMRDYKMIWPKMVLLKVDNKHYLTDKVEYRCTCLALVHVTFDFFLTGYESFRKIHCKNSVSCSSYLQNYKLL